MNNALKTIAGIPAAIIQWALAILFTLGPVASLVLWVVGLAFGDRNPAHANFAGLWFMLFLWVVGVAVYAVASIIVGRDNSPGISVHTGMLLIAGLWVVRLGPAIALFPHVYVATGVISMLLVLHKITNRTREGTMQTVNGEEISSQASSNGITFRAEKPRHSFVQVIGQTDLKARLLEAGKDVVSNSKNGTRNGILLSGDPGNGKTFMAEALAGSLHLPFISVSNGDFASRWVNNTTENVVKVFRDAAAQAPCVLFIDEIDSLISNRDNASSSEEGPKITNTLLTEIVNIRRAGVVLIAATNFIDRLDPAAIREGRFDFKIEITPPDAAARKHLITMKCASVPYSQEAIENVVRRWEGFSVARITAIADEAVRSSKGEVLTFEIMQKALRTIQGRKGKIPEDTPVIEQLTMMPNSKQRLNALAARMIDILEIEAMGGSVPRGVLFYGPPGTGKTLTARALAKTAGWAFLSVSGIDLISDPKRIDKLMAEASELRPCVVFIDEADDVFKDRRYSQSAAVTNKLLAAMDGAGGKVPDVLFIAATNHPDEMDSAALRGGRFTEKIEFTTPDVATLVEFLTKWKALTRAHLSSSLSVEVVAARLEGNSMANVSEILQMAINNAITRRSPEDEVAIVDMIDLESALASVQGT